MQRLTLRKHRGKTDVESAGTAPPQKSGLEDCAMPQATATVLISTSLAAPVGSSASRGRGAKDGELRNLTRIRIWFTAAIRIKACTKIFRIILRRCTPITSRPIPPNWCISGSTGAPQRCPVASWMAEQADERQARRRRRPWTPVRLRHGPAARARKSLEFHWLRDKVLQWHLACAMFRRSLLLFCKACAIFRSFGLHSIVLGYTYVTVPQQ